MNTKVIGTAAIAMLVVVGCDNANLKRAEAVVPFIISGMVQIPDKNYMMSKTEVTQRQWVAVMGENPSHFKGSDNPVESVSWDDCQEFLKKLNALPSVKGSGLVFRLPTAEEWEYACLAGATGDYCKLADGTEINEGTVDDVAWYGDNAGGAGQTHPVGQKEPNAFGLYDMLGNVSEWCEDLSEAGGGSTRLNRGACCYNYGAKNCTASHYGYDTPNYRPYGVGLRLAASQE